MANDTDIEQSQLVNRLADGFAALLKQVDELKRHNQEVEKFLGYHSYEDKSPKAPTSDEHNDREMCIQKGIEASERLKDTKWILTCGERSVDTKGKQLMPEGHPAIDREGSHKKVACPFASIAKYVSIEQQQQQQQQQFTLASPRTQRPDSLPTPPETREQYMDSTDAEIARAEQAPRPASVTGSAGKCPIRMLDERPAEEVAEYFETHKHEIPRSHEICVKRYQRNEQGLRLLDAKYGGLVTMIQGLGMKHQPLLHEKDGVEGDRKPDDAVEKWAAADERAHGPESTRMGSDEGGAADPEGRVGYFDRPLKEIRVGESPSRPWGISVPAGALKAEDDLPEERTPGPIPPPKASMPPKRYPKASNKQESDGHRDRAQVIFNGPVFIGYAPEEAAAFLRQSGLGE